MFCSNCGNTIDEKAVICVHCGVATHRSMTDLVDDGHIGWGILGFFVPIAGLILYLIWKDTKPRSSKSAGIGALAHCILSMIF